MDHLYRLLTISCLSMALVLSCTGGAPTIAGNDGSGTGIGNGTIMGKVVYSDNTPVKNAMVRLRTDAYLADTSGKIPLKRNDTLATVSTDTAGAFEIDSVKTGNSYCIEVLDQNSNSQNSGTLYKIGINKSDTFDTIVHLSTRIVKPVKIIKGSIVLSGLAQNAYIQFFGLEKIGRTDSMGRFEITNLPAGECEEGECEYKLRILVPQINGGFKKYNSELEIKTDSTGNIKNVNLELGDKDEVHD